MSAIGPGWARVEQEGTDGTKPGYRCYRPADSMMCTATPKRTSSPSAFRQAGFLSRAGFALFLIGTLLSACGGGNSSSAEFKKLAGKVMVAPFGYKLDPTPGAVGQITPALFDRYGGDTSPVRAGFVAGFKANYVDESTGEGISVTILQFKSPATARRYLAETAPQTLSYAAATHAPYPPIPGAVAVDGTKPYAGEYSHGVLMVRGDFYAQVVYVNVSDLPAPIELKSWAVAQYDRLTPA